MTTYILHGGNERIENESNQRFWSTFTSLVSKSQVSIAHICWARPLELWQERFQDSQTRIIKQAGPKNTDNILIENLKQLQDKINDIDVIYFYGGEYKPLEPYLADLPKLKSLVLDKVFIGSSLGAFVACKYSINSFDWDGHKINEGLSLVPISVLCHWNIEEQKKEKITVLQKTAPNLPILTLNEAEFIQFVV